MPTTSEIFARFVDYLPGRNFSAGTHDIAFDLEQGFRLTRTEATIAYRVVVQAAVIEVLRLCKGLDSPTREAQRSTGDRRYYHYHRVSFPRVIDTLTVHKQFAELRIKMSVPVPRDIQSDDLRSTSRLSKGALVVVLIAFPPDGSSAQTVRQMHCTATFMTVTEGAARLGGNPGQNVVELEFAQPECLNDIKNIAECVSRKRKPYSISIVELVNMNWLAFPHVLRLSQQVSREELLENGPFAEVLQDPTRQTPPDLELCSDLDVSRMAKPEDRPETMPGIRVARLDPEYRERFRLTHPQHCQTGVFEEELHELCIHDRRQAEAQRYFLMKSDAYLQGPPGTGKSWQLATHTGICKDSKLPEAKICSILTICSTNEATDDLFFKTQEAIGCNATLRLGGQSKSDETE